VKGILVNATLLAAFLAAMAIFPFMEKLRLKIGWLDSFIVTQLFWALALVPFWFFNNRPKLAIFGMIFVGIGLSGTIYFVEPIIANIIDEDELKTGKTKAGSYYGINGLINRLNTILTFLIIAIVLRGYGSEEYLVGSDLAISGLKNGLCLLLVPVSIAGDIVVFLLLFFFSLHGNKLREMQEALDIDRRKSE
jgi:glycoside/pentoside/hexuronide:cation symporter, GPH family